MLSYFFPDKKNGLYPKVFLRTGTVQDTVKNSMDNVSMDWKVSQYSITYYIRLSRTNLTHHVVLLWPAN